MRKSLAAQRQALAMQEQDDEELALTHERELAYLDKLERAMAERRNDLQMCITSTFAGIENDLAQVRDLKIRTIQELRGQTPTVVNNMALAPPAEAPAAP